MSKLRCRPSFLTSAQWPYPEGVFFVWVHQLTRDSTPLIASWFCIQCLARFFQGLSISLLEVNTFGHAICTLFIYALWWNKPLDVTEPETITYQPNTGDGRRTAQRLAAMCTKSKLEHQTAEFDFFVRDDHLFVFRVRGGYYGKWIPDQHNIPHRIDLVKPANKFATILWYVFTFSI